MTFLISTSKDGRLISNLIKALLKSKMALQIKRLQYVKDYKLDDKGKIVKTEEKLLWIKFEESKKEKLTGLLDKFLVSEYEVIYLKK